MSTAEVHVNGRSEPMSVAPHLSALDWLRGRGLTGAKEGCAEGECGACAIMVARNSTTGDGTTEWVSINACLIPAASMAGQEVVTAEGLGTATALHPVQHELATRGGSQCGYCTPGFVCSMAAEYYRAGRGEHADPTGASVDGHEPAAPDPNGPGAEADAEHGANGFDLHALSGTLCRCTGYRPIKDAAYALGQPAAGDVFAARRDQPPPIATPIRITADTAEFVRPANLAE